MSKIGDDIKNIIEKDPAAKGWLDVLLFYPGFHAIVFHRVANWFWMTNRLKWVGRLFSSLARLLTGVEIHPGATVGKRVFIDHGCGIVIGETAEIGDDCTIYQGVTLGGTSLMKGEKRHPTLKEGVIVGAGAKILGPFTVGKNAKVGSNAVVLSSVPADSTFVGVPAREVIDDYKEHNIDSVSFSAYGVSSAANDPIELKINSLMKKIQDQDHELALLKKKLSQSDE